MSFTKATKLLARYSSALCCSGSLIGSRLGRRLFRASVSLRHTASGPKLYASFFDSLLEQESRLYSAAYIIPSPKLGNPRKHRNHLQLLELMLREQAPSRIADAKSLEAVYAILRSFPSIGPFLGFQFAIDLNYSAVVNFSEMDFVVAGPGARDGIRRCFADTAGLSDADVIRAVSDIREKEFARLSIDFPDLWGRPLQLVDLQNLFCEVDKYSRVVFPSSPGASQRKRIKQLYRSSSLLPPQWYPPKWRLNPPAAVLPAFGAQARELLHRGRQQAPRHLTRI